LGGTLSTNGDYQYSEDKPYYKITASYPSATGLSLAADAKARATIEQGIAQQIASFKSDSSLDTMTAQDAQMQNISGDHKYTLDMQYKAYTSSTTVSYAYQVYADTLGAHPNAYYKTFVFDQDGNAVQLADLFDSQSAWLKDLSTLVTKEVTRQLAQLSGGGTVVADLYPEGLAANPDNFQSFYLDGSTLGILIPPYQVAAYAAGSFDVRVPLASLAKDLRK
jgi:hypothetical protein